MAENKVYSWDLLSSDDEDYTEEEFYKFLTKSKENLQKLALKKQAEDSEIIQESDINKDECDKDFMTFLGQLKNGLKISDKSTISNVSQNASPNVSKRSLGGSLLEESPKIQTSEKIPTSNPILHEIEEEFSISNRVKCARKLYEYFNEKIFENKLPLDMELEWSVDLRTTAGKTTARRKENVFFYCKILLSTKVLTTYERLRDTLLHEMCHAAVFVISQIPGDIHGPLWHTWAARCNLILPDITIPQRCHSYEISYPFYYQCNNCSWKCGRYKRSAKLAKALCPKCRSSLSLIKS